MEQLIIAGIFLVAVGYMGRRVYQTLFRKEAGCAKGCGCATDKQLTTKSVSSSQV
jgi:FeoB-associated Cys-rich membrane protein